MNCPSCGIAVGDSNNFCASCGKRLNKDVPKTDFEVGKIAALDTIKTDIRNWVLGLGAIAALLGFIGVREYVSRAVDSAITAQLSSLAGRIEKASNDAAEATAKARIETKQLDSTIDGLNGKAMELTKGISTVESEKHRVLSSVQGLHEQQQRMIAATNDLDDKRKQLARIIETENLTTLFAKMRSDFYRIRTVEARVEFIAADRAFPSELNEYFSFAQIGLRRKAAAAPQDSLVAQLHVVDSTNPTFMSLDAPASAKPSATSVIYNYVLFDPFRRRLEGKPMSTLNGIDSLELEYRTLVDNKPDEKVKNFRRFVAAVGEIKIEILVNNVVVAIHRLRKPDIVAPPESEQIVKDGLILYRLTQDESTYKDVSALYGQAISSGAKE